MSSRLQWPSISSATMKTLDNALRQKSSASSEWLGMPGISQRRRKVDFCGRESAQHFSLVTRVCSATMLIAVVECSSDWRGGVGFVVVAARIEERADPSDNRALG
jgi:hypothetical protein